MGGNSGHRKAWLLLGCCLLIMCSGCWPRPRHGLVVRGDFSLELNRIPWMTGRGVEYAGDCCDDAACCDSCGCAACPAGACRGGVPAGGPAGADGAAAQVAYHNDPRFFPVPTKPVFSPRTDIVSIPTSPGLIQQPDCVRQLERPTPAEADDPLHIDPPEAAAPELEVIPPPPGDKPLSRDTSGNAKSKKDWAFVSPEPTSQAAKPVAPRSPGEWVSRR